MGWIKPSGFIFLLLFFTLYTIAQTDRASLPPAKNLWIIACANGGTLKSKKSFSLLVKVLSKEYHIAENDTNTVFLFLPDMTGVVLGEEETGNRLDTTAPFTLTVTDTLVRLMAARYEAAKEARLPKKLGLIYPHLLVKEYFTFYKQQPAIACYFDTIRTLVYSSQPNIYFERSADNTKMLTQNEKEYKQRLGSWYSLLHNEEDEHYLRKVLTRKTGDLYIKISQLTTTALPGGLEQEAFTDFIKAGTTVRHNRDSTHVLIRFGLTYRSMPVTDLRYTFTNRWKGGWLTAVDSISFDGNYTAPDSIRIAAAFLYKDPLLGKKIVHCSYTLPFPPKMDLSDSLTIYKYRWLLGALLFVALIIFLIWYRRRQQRLAVYQASFYSLFKDVPQDKYGLPNKIQVLILYTGAASAPYFILQPGHRLNTFQAFMFEDGQLLVTAREKIFKQAPLLSGNPAADAIELRLVRTSIRKLAKRRKNNEDWLHSIDRLPGSNFTLNTTASYSETRLTADRKPAGTLYFSRSHPFPQFPVYYNNKTDALFFATYAINEWMKKLGDFSLGPCQLIVLLPGGGAGLLHVSFLATAKIRINYFTVIHSMQAAAAYTEDLLTGFLSDEKACPVLLIGIGLAEGAAFYLPYNKDIGIQAVTAAKQLMEIIAKNGLAKARSQDVAPYLNVVSFTFGLLVSAGYADPVFTWEVVEFPLKLTLAKELMLGNRIKKTFIKSLPLSAEGRLTTRIPSNKHMSYALYLAPSGKGLYLKHINPVEKFSFRKNVSLLLELNLREEQLLINGKSYDIKI